MHRSPTVLPMGALRVTRSSAASALLVAGIMLSGCSNQPNRAEVNRVADEARTEIDRLAADVGSVAQVKQDNIGDCVPGDKDSGKDLIYALDLKVAPDALQQVRGPIADRYRADGWTVSARGEENTAFRKDNVTIGVDVFENGRAYISGTGGCVE